MGGFETGKKAERGKEGGRKGEKKSPGKGGETLSTPWKKKGLITGGGLQKKWGKSGAAGIKKKKLGALQ